jgi:hypothetical protein
MCSTQGRVRGGVRNGEGGSSKSSDEAEGDK